MNKNNFLLRISNYKLIPLLVICNLQFIICNSFAQQSEIDSLLSLIKKDKEDTNKINHLNKLSREYLKIGSYDSAAAFADQALRQAELASPAAASGVIPEQVRNSLLKGKANAYNNLGNVDREQGNYPKALDYFFKALKIDEELHNKEGMAKRLGNIGNVYKDQGDPAKALDYDFRALKMAEEVGDKNGIAADLGNIGIVYFNQGDYSKALDYYFKALKIKEEIGNKYGIANTLGNIGSAYSDQADKLTANHSPQKDSLKQKALDYFFKALKMDEELGDQNGIEINLGNIGSLYTDINKYAEAEKYLLDALKLEKEIGDLNDERQIEEVLTNLYTKTNRDQLALEHYKKAMALKDTLFNEEKNKEITRKEMNYEFEKKAAAAAAAAEKQQAVAEAEKRKQQVILYSVIGGLLVVLLFAGFVFRSLRITRKQKLIIEDQKKHVEEKQKEILDSIHYARRIQTALLPTEKYVEKTLMRLMNK